ncbi:MAG: hypothetical protein B7733_13870 [Myxococcales bacterium FL481]|nr:MAG: hypothetical protein B7733_13870 [Myxococcales bacterium FL481]
MSEEEDSRRQDPPAPSGGESSGAGSSERAPLPSWNRTRTKRREKRSDATDDAFTRGVRGAGVAAVKQGRLVAMGVAALVAVLAGGVYLYQQYSNKGAEASRAVARAAALQARAFVGDAEQLGLPKDAVPPSPVVPDEAARTTALRSALEELEATDAPGSVVDLLAAANAMRAGDGAQALERYEAFLKAVPADHALAFLAHEGVVLAKAATSDTDGALARLGELLDAPGHYSEAGAFYRDVLLAHRGRLLEAANKPEQAASAYRLVHQEFDLNDTNPGVMDEFVRKRLEVLDPGALTKTPAADSSSGGTPSAKSADSKSSDSKSSDSKSAAKEPGETKAGATESAASKPGETKAGE